MKRITTLLSLLILCTTLTQGQNILIKELDGTTVNGQTITVNSLSGIADINHELMVINNDAGAKKINCKRYELSVTPSTKNYFCWFLCLNEVNAGVYLLTHPASQCVYINSGDTVSSFSAHHKPQTNPGTSSYRYVWFDLDNPLDSSYVDIVFNIALGTNELNKTSEIKIFPNPAAEETTVSFTEGGTGRQILVYNVFGQKVAEHKLNNAQGNFNLDLSMFDEGIYFVSLYENGKAIQTKRLVVSR